MLSKDDPIVSYTSMPLESISKNENIKLFETDRGGHLCWFEGFKPKRWYPKPVLQYLRELRQLEWFLSNHKKYKSLMRCLFSSESNMRELVFMLVRGTDFFGLWVRLK